MQEIVIEQIKTCAADSRKAGLISEAGSGQLAVRVRASGSAQQKISPAFLKSRAVRSAYPVRYAISFYAYDELLSC
ncbi:MAG TPA: hypothetical protein O0X39_07935, partial [Methanocorpusculum sp.]|nr:hypothetical protein [Methanocorpusculum sp.]